MSEKMVLAPGLGKPKGARRAVDKVVAQVSNLLYRSASSLHAL